MNDQSEQIKKNFLSQWIRLAFVALYVIVFALLWRFIAILLLVVIILQSLYRVIAANNNSSLLTFSEGLGNFLMKVLQYVLYLSDEKPIDFDAFFNKEKSGSMDEENITEAEVVAETESEADSTESSKQNPADTSGNKTDDVLADISFTEKNESGKDSGEDEEDPEKKSD